MGSEPYEGWYPVGGEGTEKSPLQAFTTPEAAERFAARRGMRAPEVEILTVSVNDD